MLKIKKCLSKIMNIIFLNLNFKVYSKSCCTPYYYNNYYKLIKVDKL